MMQQKRKRLIIGFIVFAAFLVAYLSVYLRGTAQTTAPNGATSSSTNPQPDFPFITSGVWSDDPNWKPEPYYGITGYLTITPAPGTEQSLCLMRGKNATLTLLLRAVALVANFTEAHVNVDPKSKWGGSLEVGLGGENFVNINNLVSYFPSGNLTVKAGQTISVSMIVATPADLPNLQKFYLNAVGISADVPILDNIKVLIYG
jgi:hypothetical protein